MEQNKTMQGELNQRTGRFRTIEYTIAILGSYRDYNLRENTGNIIIQIPELLTRGRNLRAEKI